MPSTSAFGAGNSPDRSRPPSGCTPRRPVPAWPACRRRCAGSPTRPRRARDAHSHASTVAASPSLPARFMQRVSHAEGRERVTWPALLGRAGNSRGGLAGAVAIADLRRLAGRIALRNALPSLAGKARRADRRAGSRTPNVVPRDRCARCRLALERQGRSDVSDVLVDRLRKTVDGVAAGHTGLAAQARCRQSPRSFSRQRARAEAEIDDGTSRRPGERPGPRSRGGALGRRGPSMETCESPQEASAASRAANPNSARIALAYISATAPLPPRATGEGSRSATNREGEHRLQGQAAVVRSSW